MNEYLMHYGIKGMKWGVRRTPAQLGHRSREIGAMVKKHAKVIGAHASNAASKAATAIRESAKAAAMQKTNQKAKKRARDMTDDELNTALKRLRLEDEYNRLMSQQSDREKSAVKSFVNKYASSALSQIADKAVTKAVNKIFEEPEKRFNVSEFDFKDTAKVSNAKLKDAVNWYSNEKTYQRLKKEYEESRKKD